MTAPDRSREGGSQLTRQRLGADVGATVARLVRERRLKPGDKLPSVSELARGLKISRSIVRDELETLAAAGLLVERRERSWVVGSDARAARAMLKPAADHAQRRSLADQAADALLELIISENLKEGASLPSTTELAERYGVSMIVVREALANLAARGVIDRRQGRGSEVAKPSPDIVGGVLRVRAHLDGIDADEFLVCRAGLESQAASLAAVSDISSEVKSAALLRHLEAMRQAGDEDTFAHHDLQFHLTLASLSGNRALRFLLDALSGLTFEFMHFTYRRTHTRSGPGGIDLVLRLHQAIADAVVQGDDAAAIEAVNNLFAQS